MSKVNLKEAFEVQYKHGAFYTGGTIQWSTDGEYLFCQKGSTVSVLSVNKSSLISSLGEVKTDQQEDTINYFTLGDSDTIVITHHKSGLFKLWDWKINKVTKLWKSIHKGPVTQITLSNYNTLMASGGSDGAVRLWNLQYHACTHSLKGIDGIVSVLKFHPDIKKKFLFGVGGDLKIHGWDIATGKEKITFSGHFSEVTSFNFDKTGHYLISSGRDRVLILWEISSGIIIRTLPVYERIEGSFIIPPMSLPAIIKSHQSDGLYVVSAGEEGIVKIWEMKTGMQIYKQDNSLISSTAEKTSNLSFTHLLYNETRNIFATGSVNHNVIVYSLESLECEKQLVGYSDEILDVACIANDSHIALATNSCDIKLYNVVSMNCQLLYGHTNNVLALATTPANINLLVSSAKDNSVRIWLFDEKTTKMSCIGHAIRHTASVNSVAISQTSTKFFTTVAQDSCLKLWEMSTVSKSHNQYILLNTKSTIKAHLKEINCVTISPNDKLIATASQDKTAKLWSAKDLQLRGVFHGHRRSVWCVRFSPIDQVLLTTSADCTMKLWSLTEFNCLKTFEGHESSILRGEFLSCGMQLITSDREGLLKLWNIKTSECISTLYQHESHVWTLAVTKDEKQIISGGSDSLLIIWKDVTEDRRMQAISKKEQLALEEQKLANLLKTEELQAALQLALKLERPLHILKIMKVLMQKQNEKLVEIIQELKPAYKETLFRCAITWNTNSRNSHIAQVVTNALILEIGIQELQTSGLSSTLEAMIPYTDRHLKRLTKLLQNVHILTYSIKRVKPDIVPIGIK